jgi:hypothetical protein
MRQRNIASSIMIMGVVAAVGMTTGCKKKGETTNADLYGSYEDNEYESDMVAAHPEDEIHESQGQGIDARTLASIDDAIRTVYITDFEHCLEIEMERLENRWLAAEFTVEFHIETSGKVTEAKMLEMKAGETKPKEKGNARPADQFDDCVEEKLLEWEFDPPPEVDYLHTYQGRVGEAW